MVLNSSLQQTYQILTNDDEMLILRLSYFSNTVSKLEFQSWMYSILQSSVVKFRLFRYIILFCTVMPKHKHIFKIISSWRHMYPFISRNRMNLSKIYTAVHRFFWNTYLLEKSFLKGNKVDLASLYASKVLEFTTFF